LAGRQWARAGEETPSDAVQSRTTSEQGATLEPDQEDLSASNEALTRLSGSQDRGVPVQPSDVLALQSTFGNHAVQRLIAQRTRAAGQQPELNQQLQQERGGGSPLPAPTRARLEGFFGSDLSEVRVHTDQQADTLASSLGASAFTTGRDMFFSNGTFAPDTDTGLHLVAHETAHTVQQAAGPVSGVPVTQDLAVSEPDDAFEQAADSAATALVTGSSPPASPSNSPTSPQNTSVQRDSDKGWLDTLSDLASSAISELGELGEGAISAIVRRIAPGLADLIDHGPLGMIQTALQDAVGGWLPSLFGGLNIGQAVESGIGSLSSTFQGLTAAVGNLNSCEAFNTVLQAISGVVHAVAENPVFEAMKSVFGAIEDAIKKVSEVVLAPAIDVLRDILGGAWHAISNVASTISGWAQTVKNYAGAAWDWVSKQLGLPGSDEGGVWDWLSKKASEVWTSIKATMAPVVGPLATVAKVLAVLTPFGQVYLLIRYAPKVVQAIQVLWQHWGDENAIRSNAISGSILDFLNSVGEFKDTLKNGVSWLTDQLVGLGSGLLELVGGISGVPLLSMAQGAVQTLSEGANHLAQWGQGELTSAVSTVETVEHDVGEFLAPYKEVLSSIGMAVANPTAIPTILMGWAWRKLPQCIKEPIINFLLDIAVTFVRAAPDLPMFGPLWSILKPGILGFLETVQAKPMEIKEAIADKLAKIASGSSMAFIVSFVKGFLLGIWDGVSMPFKAIWSIIEGLSSVEEYFENLAASALGVGTPQPQPVTGSGAPAPAAPAGNNVQKQQLGTRAKAMANELQPPVTTVVGNFWSAAEEYFSSSGGATFDTLVNKLGQVWTSMLQAMQGAGASLAEKAIGFFTGDAAEDTLGDTIGNLAGNLTVQLALDALSGATWEAISPTLNMIARFLNWPMEALGEVFSLLGKLGGFLVDGVKSLGSMVAEAGGGALHACVEAVETIGRDLVQFAEELLGEFKGLAEEGEGAAAKAELAAAKEAEAAAAKEAKTAVARQRC
jgi:phage-related protein